MVTTLTSRGYSIQIWIKSFKIMHKSGSLLFRNTVHHQERITICKPYWRASSTSQLSKSTTSLFRSAPAASHNHWYNFIIDEAVCTIGVNKAVSRTSVLVIVRFDIGKALCDGVNRTMVTPSSVVISEASLIRRHSRQRSFPHGSCCPDVDNVLDD